MWGHWEKRWAIVLCLGCPFLEVTTIGWRPSPISVNQKPQDTVFLVVMLIVCVAAIFVCFAMVAICYRWQKKEIKKQQHLTYYRTWHIGIQTKHFHSCACHVGMQHIVAKEIYSFLWNGLFSDSILSELKNFENLCLIVNLKTMKKLKGSFWAA